MLLLRQLDQRTATIVRLIGLALISWTVVSGRHYPPGGHGRHLVVLLLFVVCLAAAFGWMARPVDDPGRGLTLDVWAMAAAGGFLTTADPNSAASAFMFVAVVTAGVRVSLERAAVVVGVAALALGVSDLIYKASALGWLAYTLGLAATLFAASNARQSAARTEQAELLLAQTQRSHEEALRAARLEESTRIAREIHDVLAHALAGLTLQLEATSALLDQGAEREQISARVQRALELAREGLQETRRAVGALRGESVSVATAIGALVDGYREACPGADVELAFDGEIERLTGQTTLSIVRIVQEALTTVRKHAPGACVRVTVDAGTGPDGGLVAVIEDRGGACAEPDGLAGSGGGYGVLGMRERAERLGGTLEAGPTADGFRVALRIPPQEVLQ